MELDDYLVLEEQIQAGKYLPKGNLAELPDMPSNSPDEIKSFYEECNRTLALYRQKLQIYEERDRAASQFSDAASMVREVNTKIAKLNTDLSDEYEEYKKVSVAKIASLRADLLESKEISTNALDRCDKLGKQIEVLESEKRQLRKRLEKKEEKLACYEADISNGYISETDGHVIGMCAERREKSAQVSDLEEEIASLKSKLAENKSLSMVEMAKLMIQNGIDYLADVEMVSDDDKSSFGEKVLKHTLSGECEAHLGQQEIDKLRIAIGCVTDRREEAQEKARKKEEEKRERMLNDMPIHIDTVKQLNNGQGTFQEIDRAPVLPVNND